MFTLTGLQNVFYRRILNIVILVSKSRFKVFTFAPRLDLESTLHAVRQLIFPVLIIRILMFHLMLILRIMILAYTKAGRKEINDM